MSAAALFSELVTAGLTVVKESGWATRGGTWAEGGKPLGIMQHHTAPPNPFPIRALYANNKIKCNIATHENGTIYLVAYRACNYSSGKGSSTVLNSNVRPGIPPNLNAKERGLTDDKGGNRYFWNYENSHPGNGSPMPGVQSEAIAISSSVVNAHFGLSEKNMISHAEWTRRKGDPYWDGSRRIIETIRSDTAGIGDDDMLPILVGTDDEDQTALADLLNQTYGTSLKLVDPYNTAMVAAVKKYLGKYTGHPEWKEGKGVGGKQYSRLLQDHAKKFASAPAPPPASGVSEARVKQLIAASKIVP